MTTIRESDIPKARQDFLTWKDKAKAQALTVSDTQKRLSINPEMPHQQVAMAVRYSLHMLEVKAPGSSVEVRVAPWSAVKILDGPASDPHNLTPPDVVELAPDVWLRLATGISSWQEEKEAGRISAVGERDNLSELLPLV
jgi:hypothetical protein